MILDLEKRLNENSLVVLTNEGTCGTFLLEADIADQVLKGNVLEAIEGIDGACYDTAGFFYLHPFNNKLFPGLETKIELPDGKKIPLFSQGVIPEFMLNLTLDVFAERIYSYCQNHHNGEKVLFVDILEGATYFNLEVLRRITAAHPDFQFDLASMKVRSYSGEQQGEFKIIKELAYGIPHGLDELGCYEMLKQKTCPGEEEVDLRQYACTFVLEDIMDSSRTIQKVVSYLTESGANEIRAGFLTVKQKERTDKEAGAMIGFLDNYTSPEIPFCFSIPDYWIVGCCLDWSIDKPTNKELEELGL